MYIVPTGKKRPPEKYLWQTAFIDSFQQDATSEPSKGKYIFKINDMNASSLDAIAISGPKLTAIKALKLSSFVMPAPSTLPCSENDGKTDPLRPVLVSNGAAPASGYPTTPSGGRIAMIIQELSSGGVPTTSGVKIHYLLKTEARSDGSLLATPEDDTYVFSTPVDLSGQISVQFTNPDTPLSFRPDRYRNVPVYAVHLTIADARPGFPPAQFPVGGYMTQMFSIPGSGLQMNDRIVVSGFTFAHPLGPEYNKYSLRLGPRINRFEGQQVGYARGPATGASDTFTLLLAPNEYYSVGWPEGRCNLAGTDVYIPARRFIIPLTFMTEIPI